MSANLHLKSNDLPDRWKRPVRVLLIGIIAACIFVVALPFIPWLVGLYPVLVAVAAAIVVLNLLIIGFILTILPALEKKPSIKSPPEVLSPSFSPFIPFAPPRYCDTV